MTGQELLKRAIKYLEAMPRDPEGYREELLQEAHQIQLSADQTVASLFLGDQETLESDLEESTEEQKPQVVRDHLAGLERELAASADPDKLLVENLYNSLQYHSPSFGRQHP